MRLVLVLCIVNCLASKVTAQHPSNLQGKWEGTLDQNKNAENNYSYDLYYKNGAFIKGTPTHYISLNIAVATDEEISGIESKRLVSDTNDFAIFSFTGTFLNGYLRYDGESKLDEHLILSPGYCTSHATLKYSNDEQFEYLTGLWKGTFQSRYCVDASVFLKRAKKKITPLILIETNISKKDSLVHKEKYASLKGSHLDTSLELKRTNTIIATYQVTTPTIHISIFDKEVIDGDTITVYHNEEKIINRQPLRKEPLIYTITAISDNRLHEFTLVAENVGSIPPNTAFMRITIGEKTYELVAKTHDKENARIVIEYIGK